MESTANVSKPMISRNIPSDLDQAKFVMKYEILKHMRSRRLLGLLVVESIIIILISVLIAGQPKAAFNSTMAAYGSWASMLVVIGATLFAGDAIVSEFQGRTGYLLFPNPIKRHSIFLGKFASSVLVMALVLAIYYAVAIVVSAALSSNLNHMELSLYSFLLAMLYAPAAIAVGMFISSILKSSVAALVLTLFLLFMILPIVDSLFSLVDAEPWFSLPFAAQSISNILTYPYPVDFVVPQPIGNNQTIDLFYHFPDVGASVAVMAIYAVVFSLLAIFFFRRREMVG